MFDFSWHHMVPFAAVTSALLVTFGIVKFDAIMAFLTQLAHKLLAKTETTVDDQLFDMTVQKLSEYMKSDTFKAHWAKVDAMLADGNLTSDEAMQIKDMICTQMAGELRQYACDVYADGAKPLIEELIDDASAFVQGNFKDAGFFKKIGISVALKILDGWFKTHLQQFLQKKGVKRIQP